MVTYAVPEKSGEEAVQEAHGGLSLAVIRQNGSQSLEQKKDSSGDEKDWRASIEKQAPGIFEKPSFKNFWILSTNLQSEWIPNLIIEQTQNGVSFEDARNSAEFQALSLRQHVLDKYLENPDLDQKTKIDMIGLNLAFFVVSYSKDDSKLSDTSSMEESRLLASSIGSLVDIGIDEIDQLERIFRVVRKSHAISSESLENKADWYITEIRRIDQENTVRKQKAYDFQSKGRYAKKGEEFSITSLETGIRCEIATFYGFRALIEAVGLEEKVKMVKTDPDMDLTGGLDFLFVDIKTNIPVLGIDTKVEQRDKLGLRLVAGNLAPTNNLEVDELSKDIPASAFSYARRNKLNVLSVRLPRYLVTDPLSADGITSTQNIIRDDIMARTNLLNRLLETYRRVS